MAKCATTMLTKKIALLMMLVGPSFVVAVHDDDDSGGIGGDDDGGPPTGGDDDGGGAPSSGTSCDACGASTTYSEEIVQYDFLVRAITMNGCPNHYSYCTGKGIGVCGAIGEEGTGTEAQENSRYWEIPANPVFNSGDLADLTYVLGTVAIALNGVSIYSGAVSTTAILDVDDDTAEWTSFDMCGGHAESTGDYHYHFPPSCLNAQAEAKNPTTDGHSPQLGWSYDGFPVYGPLYTGGVELTAADLDECGGKREELPGLDTFAYRYYLTGATSDLYTLPGDPKPDNEDYPFTMNCYVGCTYDELLAGSCSGDSGVTSDHVATALEGYTEEFSDYGEGTSSRLCTGDLVATPSPTPSPPTDSPTSHPQPDCVVCDASGRSLMMGDMPCC